MVVQGADETLGREMTFGQWQRAKAASSVCSAWVPVTIYRTLSFQVVTNQSEDGYKQIIAAS